MFLDTVKQKHLKSMCSDETRAKISESMKKYRKEHPWTVEQKQKFANSKYGNKNFAGHKLTEKHKEALNKSHYKKVYCIDENENVIARFDTVKLAARWWHENGYSTVKDWHQLCDMIKSSNKKDKYIKGLKWIYE